MTQRLHTTLALLLIPLFALVVLTSLALPTRVSPLMINAISIDLLVTIPLLYFLAIRKSNIPKISILPVTILCLVLGTNLLPGEKPVLAFAVSYIVPVVELSVFGYLFYAIRTLQKSYQGESTPDFMDRIRLVLGKHHLPQPLVAAATTELSMVYYGLIKWKGVHKGFTYHKENGLLGLLGVFVFLVLMETGVAHLLLATWSPVAAWVLTGISLYTSIQLLAHTKACVFRPILIEDEQVILRHGLLGDLTIRAEEIVEIRKLKGSEDGAGPNLGIGSPLNPPNVLIRLRHAETIKGIYGTGKSVTSFTLYVDQPDDFIAILEEKLNGHQS